MLLEESGLLQVLLVQEVLEDWVVLVHQGVRGSSISIRGRGSSSRVSSSSRRPSIPIGIPPSIGWPSTSIGIPSSFRGSPFPTWSPVGIVIFNTLSGVFPSLCYGGPLNICASLGIFLFYEPSIIQHSSSSNNLLWEPILGPSTCSNIEISWRPHIRSSLPENLLMNWVHTPM